MSIDDLARAAASDARRTAAREVDLTSSLARLHRTRHRRNMFAVAGVAVAVVAVVFGGNALVSQRAGTDPVTPPATSQEPSVAVSACHDDPAITCSGGGFRAALPVPLSVTLPVNFQQQLSLLNPAAVEAYRSDIGSTGVTVIENAVPVRYDQTWSADPTAGSSAESMATWLAKRPFLADARVTPTTVGGRKAWRVSGELRPGTALPVSKAGEPAAPTFLEGDVTAAYSKTIIGEYTLLDLPGAGVTVIWSWTVDHSAPVLVDNQTFVDGLRFG